MEQPVKLATCRVPPETAAAGRAEAAAAALVAREETAPLSEGDGVSWARFGDEMVYLGTADSRNWGAFAAAAARAGLAPQERPGLVDRQRLHVVIQKGRLFQREHPDAVVLVDKGRFLLVDMDPGRARQADAGDMPCYAVRPLDALESAGAGGRNRIVFEARPRTAAPAPDPVVQALVDRVSRADFEEDLVRLVQFPTRFSTSDHYMAACEFAEQRFAALGYATSRQSVAADGEARSQNVVARRNGSGPEPRGSVLVTAHLDSVNHEGDAASPAPGADDDGSGSAGVIEIARALKDHRGAHDLCFVLFGGEEQGLLGSKRFVAAMPPAQRAQVRAVVNMDMVGTRNTPAPTVLLEGAALSQAVIDGLADAAATYTALAVQTSLNPFNSDHVSFLRQGIPAVLTIEGADSANEAIHTARDTLDHIDFGLALEILRMNTAFVARASDQA